jgi:hypothetical protein
MSCLFDSLAPAVNSSGAQVRSDIVEFLECNQEIEFNKMTLKEWMVHSSEEPGEPGGVDEYLERMRRNHQWGGGIEILAAVLLYRSNITVHFEGEAYIFSPGEGASESKNIHLQWTGSHYVFMGVTN